MTGLPQIPFASMFSDKEEVGPPKSFMIYGAPGTWKTSTAGGLIKVPGFDKILYIDVDNGTEVFINDPEVYSAIGQDFGAPGEKRINIAKIDKTDPSAFGMLQYLLGMRNEQNEFVKGAAFGLGYDAIILDAGDVAQEVAVQWLMANTFNDKGQVDTRGAWGAVSIWISDIGWALQNDPDVVGVWVVHSKEGVEENGAYKIKPKFQGSAKDSIAGIPSLVAYVEFKADPVTKEVKLVANVGKSDVITSKNRYMLDPIWDFDVVKLYEVINDRIASAQGGAPAPAQSGIPAMPPIPATQPTEPAAVAA